MGYTKLDGNLCANKHLTALKSKIGNKTITLAVIQVGTIAASTLYIEKKLLACADVGIKPLTYKYPTSITESEIITTIHKLNQDPTVNGILVQLPLPKHINPQTIVETIDHRKDVDGFHPYNLGRLAQKNPSLQPCTPLGIKLLLEHYSISLAGLNIVIVGASNIVGLPTTLTCLMAKATVTVCHSKTKNLSFHIQNADCIISAIGKTDVINANDIKQNAIVVDVGTNHINNKVVGDIDFAVACKKAQYITPVPGGVGPMTVAALLLNTYHAYQLQNSPLSTTGNIL